MHVSSELPLLFYFQNCSWIYGKYFSPLDSYFNRERVSLDEIHEKYGHNGQVSSLKFSMVFVQIWFFSYFHEKFLDSMKWFHIFMENTVTMDVWVLSNYFWMACAQILFWVVWGWILEQLIDKRKQEQCFTSGVRGWLLLAWNRQQRAPQ